MELLGGTWNLKLTVDIIDNGSWRHIDLQDVRGAAMRMDDLRRDCWGVRILVSKRKVGGTEVVVERRSRED